MKIKLTATQRKAGVDPRGALVHEAVVQHAPDGKSRIVRRRYPKRTGAPRYQNWRVERLRADGVWERSKNGPWDYMYNARAELRGELPK